MAELLPVLYLTPTRGWVFHPPAGEAWSNFGWLVGDRRGHAMSGLSASTEGETRSASGRHGSLTRPSAVAPINPTGTRRWPTWYVWRCSWCSTLPLRPNASPSCSTTHSMTAPIPVRWRPARPVTEIRRTPRSIPLPRPSWPARNPRRPRNPSGNRARPVVLSRSGAGKAIAPFDGC